MGLLAESPYRAYLAEREKQAGLLDAAKFVMNKVDAVGDKIAEKTTREVSPEYMQAIKDHMEAKIRAANPGVAIEYKDIKNPMKARMSPTQQHVIHFDGRPSEVQSVMKIEAPSTRTPMAMAHELGHATGKAKSLRRNAGMRLAANQISGTLVGMDAQLAKHPSVVNNPFAKARLEGTMKVLRPLAAATHIPTLLEEGRASYEGLKAIKAVHGTKEMVRSIPFAALGFSTYAANAAAPLVAPKATAILRGVGRAILRR